MVLNSEDLTPELVAQHAPKVADALKAQGAEAAQADIEAKITAAREDGKKEGEAAGAKASEDAIAKAKADERKRISDIQAAALPGQEALVAKAVNEGMSFEAFAVESLKSAKAAGPAAIAALQNADKKVSEVGASAASDNGELSPEAVAKASVENARRLGIVP